MTPDGQIPPWRWNLGFAVLQGALVQGAVFGAVRGRLDEKPGTIAPLTRLAFQVIGLVLVIGPIRQSDSFGIVIDG